MEFECLNCLLCSKSTSLENICENVDEKWSEILWKFQEITGYELLSTLNDRNSICKGCVEAFDSYYAYRENLIAIQIRMNSLKLFPDEVKSTIEQNQWNFQNAEMYDEIELDHIMLKRDYNESTNRRTSQKRYVLEHHSADNTENQDPSYQSAAFDFESVQEIPDYIEVMRKRRRKRKQKAKSKPKVEVMFKCNFCTQVCISKRELEKHLKVVHEVVYECDFCGKKLSSKSTCEIHILRSHLKAMGKYVCDKCGKACFTTGDLKYHIAAIHDLGEFKCEKCPRVFKSATTLQVHKSKVHDPRTKFCELCGLYFTSIEFRSHMRATRHDFNFMCDHPDCGKKFLSETFLSVHKRNQHNATDNFKCEICNKFYPTLKKMQRHQSRTHFSPLFQCPVAGCLREYTRIEAVKSHIKKHSNLSEQEKAELLSRVYSTRNISAPNLAIKD